MNRTDTLDPVVFKLGSALYICQIFENSLVLLHHLIDDEEAIPGKTINIGIDYSRQTLGTLIKLLKSRIAVPQNALDYIFDAIGIRNQIVHGYLTKPENVAHFENRDGIEFLVRDLDVKLNAVRARDFMVCKLIDQYLEKYGTSTDELKQWAEEHSNLYN